MEKILNEMEVRVLGCLIEKELSTPDYYPLSLNALTNACNQKSNRDPVLELEETDVVKALDGLRFKGLALQSAEGGRVPKYRHNLAEKLRLTPVELSIMAELFLRGPQTVGELRGRAERMAFTGGIEEVEAVLAELMEREPPLLMQLARQPGQKESRFGHLFCGEPQAAAETSNAPPEVARLKVQAEEERIGRLAEEVAELRREVTELRQELAAFKTQFE